MFQSTWSWVVPLVCALAVFAFVLATTPPGFGSLGTLAFSTGADPATYAAGAAASLGLLTLVALGVVCGVAEVVIRRVMRL